MILTDDKFHISRQFGMTEDQVTNFKALTFIDQSRGITKKNTSLIHRHLAKRRLTKSKEASNIKQSTQEPSVRTKERSGKEDKSSAGADQFSRLTRSKKEPSQLGKLALKEAVVPCWELCGRSPINRVLPNSRIDPFEGLGIPITKRRHLELLDYLTNVIWPTFSQHGGGNLNNPYASHWLERSYSNYALRHAFAMAASLHMSTSTRFSTTAKQKQDMYVEQLTHQHEAIRDMRDQLTRRNYPIEDLMMTIICLWSNPIRLYDLSNPEPNPFTPLLKGGLIDVYCNWEYSAIHWEALMKMVAEVGGVRNIKVYGIPWIISMYVSSDLSCVLTRMHDSLAT